MAPEKEGVSYCALCAWRGDCKLKYRFQDSPSLYCKEYTRDLSIKIDEPGEGAGEDSGGER